MNTWKSKLGTWHITGAQEMAFDGMLVENQRFGRLASSVRAGEKGRGLTTLNTIIKAIELSQRPEVLGDRAVFSPDGLIAGALHVHPERIALCDPAGQANPADHLPPHRASEFLRVDDRT